MRLRIWLLCCVIVTTSAEGHVTGAVTVNTTEATRTVGHIHGDEARIHHELLDFDVSFVPTVENRQNNATDGVDNQGNKSVSEDRMHDVNIEATNVTFLENDNTINIDQLLERMHESNVTMPNELNVTETIIYDVVRMLDSVEIAGYQSKDVTYVPGSDVEIPLQDLNGTSIETANVTEASLSEIRMHENIEVFPVAHANSTEYPPNEEGGNDSTDMLREEFNNVTDGRLGEVRNQDDTKFVTVIHDNATENPPAEVLIHNSTETNVTKALMLESRMQDLTDEAEVTGFINSTSSNVAEDEFDGPYLRHHDVADINVPHGFEDHVAMEPETNRVMSSIRPTVSHDTSSVVNKIREMAQTSKHEVRFGHDANTVGYIHVHAELSEDEDLIDLQPPRQLELVVAQPSSNDTQTQPPVTTPVTSHIENDLRLGDFSNHPHQRGDDMDGKSIDLLPTVELLQKGSKSATTSPWMATAKPQDATPVMSDLDRISEDDNENGLVSTPPSRHKNATETSNATSPFYREVEDRIHDPDSQFNGMTTNASLLNINTSFPSPLFVASVLGSHITSYQNDTRLDLMGRTLTGQRRQLFPFDQGVCLALPYPCGPGESCNIINNKVQCTANNGDCQKDPYPCDVDEACRIIGGRPTCFPSLGLCVASPYPCNRTSDACRVVDNKVACYPNHCIGVTCSNHGICKELGYDYRCECNPGYEGRNCEDRTPDDLGPCNPNPCHGDCECKESCMHELGYYCASAGGFTGKNCTVPVPKVTCGERSIMVDITKDLYQEFDQGVGNTYFYVSPDSAASRTSDCEAAKTRDGFRITIPLPFSNCHSRQARTGSALIVSNRVIADRRNSRFSMETPVVDFQCIYRRQYQLVTSLKPVVTKPIRREGYGRFTPDVELCKISNCPNSCPLEYSVANGAVYTVGELIYFSITALPAGAFRNYVTVITGVTLSCDETGSSFTEMELISDGCPVDESLYMTVSPGRVACASLQTPRSPCATFYIHLHITLCHDSELVPCPTGQTLRCAANHRQARSVLRMDKSADARIGPITIITGDVGVDEIELYPGASNTTFKLNTKKEVPAPVRPSKAFYATLLTVAMPCLFLILFIALLSLACCKRMSRVTDARISNVKGFKKLDASPPYTAAPECYNYNPYASADCKFCGLVDPLCRCGDKITYTSTRLHAVEVKVGICPCGCAGPKCQCSLSCRLCSCNPRCPCSCGNGPACMCRPTCLLCSCNSKPCPCGCATGSTCKSKPCPCGCAAGSACKCQPPCQLCSCNCVCKCNLKSKCSCVSTCRCVRCSCNCDKSCKCCN